MKLIKLKCEECHAISNIEVIDEQLFLICSFCGNKWTMIDKEHAVRVRESEVKIRIKELENTDKENKRKDERKRLIYNNLWIFVLFGFFLLVGVGQFLGDRLERRNPIPVNILVEFIESSDEAVEITINRRVLGVQSSGTSQTYYTELRKGSNEITFRVGDISESRNFEAVESDYYFHFLVEEVSRFLRSNIIEITFDLLPPHYIRQLR